VLGFCEEGLDPRKSQIDAHRQNTSNSRVPGKDTMGSNSRLKAIHLK